MGKTFSQIGLQCRHLTLERESRDTGRIVILDDITADFDMGAMALVSGDTGAGKSTLIHLLAGLLRPTSGEVATDQGVVSRFTAPHRDRWRRQVGIVFQDLQLIADLSVLENLLLPVIPRQRSWHNLLQSTTMILQQTDLADYGHRRVYRLSGGQRQRVAMARAMMGAPRFLLLDEPTAFQDDRHARDMLAIWHTYAQKGTCVVICSHDPRLRQAAGIQQHWVLKHGRLERRA
jgi:ABC-type lipoprotein export system ATPase subunit